MNYSRKRIAIGLIFLIYTFYGVCLVHADSINTSEQNTSTDSLDFQLTAYGLYGTTTVNIGIDKSTNGNYGFGLQLLFGDKTDNLTNYLGLDVAYIRMFNVFGNDLNRGTTYLQALFINEVVIWSNDWFGFSFQSGLGPYIGLESDSRFGFDFLVGGGVEISINEVSIQILSRVDMIYYSFDEVIANITFAVGIGYNF
ncbi:MAG: hypothetical protein JW822_14245 [Spirochaetales bacterium]|nr:hypothetical protein [Spirochaetales bacterium]